MLIFMFVRAIEAHYGAICVTFSTTPDKIIDICYKISFYNLLMIHFR